MICLGCGVEKDFSQKELYPYADDCLTQREPIAPLYLLDVQGPSNNEHPLGYSEYRQTLVCHSCFHRLNPDQWISEECWVQLNPVIPYARLPLLGDTLDRCSDPTTFPGALS